MCMRLRSTRNYGLTVSSYVQDVLETNSNFGYKTLNSIDGIERLKFWTVEMCADHPNWFDFVITVSIA